MASNNLFPSVLDNSNSNPNQNVMGNVPRLAPSPMGGSQQGQVNANGNVGSAMNGLPMAAGSQMDVNFLYQKVVELSELLRDNRERTQSIVGAAEELAVSANPPRLSYETPGLSRQVPLTRFRLALLPMVLLLRFRKPMLKSLVFECMPS